MLHLLFAIILTVTPFQIATATPGDRELRDMPVMVLYCDEDPGTINIGGGKEPMPETLVENGLCTPAEGVSLTFVLVRKEWDFEKDDPEEDWEVDANSWFARCDMDADGRCTLNAPEGFDIVLGVFLHDATVKPGYTAASFQRTTHNFTEFAGYGLALIPNGDPVGEIADHQTLALNITQTDKPANVLTEWDVEDDTDDTDLYLATNSDGWVSNIVKPQQEIEISLENVTPGTKISAICSANDDASADVHVVVDDDDLEIHIPDTQNDIRCDIQIGS